jgi:orotate phosphoribosyltransferase-like protein
MSDRTGTAPRAPHPLVERVKLVLGWTIVGLPAAWAVTQVIAKSLALFR